LLTPICSVRPNAKEIFCFGAYFRKWTRNSCEACTNTKILKIQMSKKASTHFASHCPLLFPPTQLFSGEIRGFVWGLLFLVLGLGFVVLCSLAFEF